MPTNVVMPQMGESIAEGTIVRWIRQVGDTVDRDEPLFEISSDKVDAEIHSPTAGILAEIRANEGETVPVDTVVAVIREAAGAETVPTATQVRGPDTGAERVAVAASVEIPRPEGSLATVGSTDRGQRKSPLVRRIAREHGIDIAQIIGTGQGGRVTKQDILGFIAAPRACAAPSSSRRSPAILTDVPAFGPGERVGKVPMSVMRRKIAEHMVLSRRTSAHVHSVFDVDFSLVAQLREAHKAEYLRSGGRLTYLSFIAKAAVDALRGMLIVNASVDGDTIVYKKDINLGIAVALESGLIVPVIHSAEEKSLIGLSRAIADVAERARNKQLKPEDVQGGTFTITNPGTFGTLFGMPIISQPQVAILAVGVVEKRPVIVEDTIAIRLRAYLTLGYDHRLIDGAVADQFMSHVKHRLEAFDEAAV